jgi:hypothetical protein
MYIILEYDTCLILALVTATLLFGSCVAFFMIREEVLFLGGFVRTLVQPGGGSYEPGRVGNSTGTI